MTSRSKSTRPFQALLLVIAIAFTLTACAYGVMTVHRIDPGRTSESFTSGHWLLEQLDRHGATLLLVELAVLAATALAAVATDACRSRGERNAAHSEVED